MISYLINLWLKKKYLVSHSYIKKIISGGQTGVDRAALDIAIKFKIPMGGWCPYGRKAEDGLIPKKYTLKETSAPTLEENSASDAIYKKRTELNARDSDGTLIIVRGALTGGTLYTMEMLEKYKKPYFVFNIINNPNIKNVVNWIISNKIKKLNVAGPRASQSENIYDSAYNILLKIINHKMLN